MGGIKKFLSFLALTISLLVALVIAFFILVVCLRNHSVIDLDLLVTTFNQVPIEIIILSTFAIGILFGLAIYGLSSIHLKRRINASH